MISRRFLFRFRKFSRMTSRSPSSSSSIAMSSPQIGSVSRASTRPPFSRMSSKASAARSRHFPAMTESPATTNRFFRHSTRCSMAVRRAAWGSRGFDRLDPAGAGGGKSDRSRCSCHRSLKSSLRCRAIETNEGTASLLLGWEWYLKQFAKILQASRRTSRNVSYCRRRILRHTFPRSMGCSTILVYAFMSSGCNRATGRLNSARSGTWQNCFISASSFRYWISVMGSTASSMVGGGTLLLA
mmetsp:Transcript_23506/g.55694  ORF Transcript_23506/g.55694 Transcript_23506/m.55694 type:complete len:242 (+) Transcript_23506:1351-2076(+)